MKLFVNELSGSIPQNLIRVSFSHVLIPAASSLGRTVYLHVHLIHICCGMLAEGNQSRDDDRRLQPCSARESTRTCWDWLP